MHQYRYQYQVSVPILPGVNALLVLVKYVPIPRHYTSIGYWYRYWGTDTGIGTHTGVEYSTRNCKASANTERQILVYYTVLQYLIVCNYVIKYSVSVSLVLNCKYWYSSWLYNKAVVMTRHVLGCRTVDGHSAGVLPW